MLTFTARVRMFVIVAGLVGMMMLGGCEDDPIIEPQTTTSEASSYGRLMSDDKLGEPYEEVVNPEEF